MSRGHAFELVGFLILLPVSLHSLNLAGARAETVKITLARGDQCVFFGNSQHAAGFADVCAVSELQKRTSTHPGF